MRSELLLLTLEKNLLAKPTQAYSIRTVLKVILGLLHSLQLHATLQRTVQLFEEANLNMTSRISHLFVGEHFFAPTDNLGLVHHVFELTTELGEARSLPTVRTIALLF